jgi:hypothetical protein
MALNRQYEFAGRAIIETIVGRFCFETIVALISQKAPKQEIVSKTNSSMILNALISVDRTSVVQNPNRSADQSNFVPV